MYEANKERTPRFRLSVTNLLLLTVIVATSLTIVVLLQQVEPLRRQLRQAEDEISQLREEVGELVIADRSKTHAIEVDTGVDTQWKWRVWVPEGSRYDLVFFCRDIPLKGYPAGGDWVTRLPPGEHTVEFRLGEVEPSGARIATIRAPRGLKATRVAWTFPKWVITRGVGRTTRTYATDKPIMLRRHRVSDEANPNTLSSATDGFMIWLEPAP